MKVDFWQLSRDPAEVVVRLIAQRALAELLGGHEEGAGLVYVSTRKDAEELSRFSGREATELAHRSNPSRTKLFNLLRPELVQLFER